MLPKNRPFILKETITMKKKNIFLILIVLHFQIYLFILIVFSCYHFLELLSADDIWIVYFTCEDGYTTQKLQWPHRRIESYDFSFGVYGGCKELLKIIYRRCSKIVYFRIGNYTIYIRISMFLHPSYCTFFFHILIAITV